MVSSCVLNCGPCKGRFHRFPNPKSKREFFIKWKVLLLKKKKYAEYSDAKIYTNLRICEQHFEKSCYSVGTKKLNYNAMPTLNLTALEDKEGSCEIQNNQPKDISNINIFQGCSKESIELPDDANDYSISNPLSDYAFEEVVLEQINADDIENSNLSIDSKNSSKGFSEQPFEFPDDGKSSISSFSSDCIFEELNLKQNVALHKNVNINSKETETLQREFIFIDLTDKKGIKLKERGKLDNEKSVTEIYDLIKLLNNDEIGFDDELFEHLKKVTESLTPSHRFCSLIFDEVNLTIPWVDSAAEDKIVKFEFYDDTESSKPEYITVFVIRGVVKMWKQPALYYLVSSIRSPNLIASTIQKVVNTAQKAGLNIVSVVCDGGQINMEAIEKLKEISRLKATKTGVKFTSCGFEINGQIVNYIIDPPYLIKLIRNHLIINNLGLTHNGVEKVAVWGHIVKLYEHDSKIGAEIGFRFLNKINEEHILEHRIKKIKASYCAQLFSRTLANTMSYITQSHKNINSNTQCLDDTAVGTAAFIVFIDRLFDSMNGYAQKPQRGKELRGPFGKVQQTFWNEEAIPVLNSMYLIKNEIRFGKKYPRKLKPSFPHYFLNNFRNYNEIEKRLLSCHVKGIYLRNFNLDLIEKYFGSKET